MEEYFRQDTEDSGDYHVFNINHCDVTSFTWGSQGTTYGNDAESKSQAMGFESEISQFKRNASAHK